MKATSRPAETSGKKPKKSPLYDHLKIEKKWQKEWEQKKMYRAVDGSKGKKFFPLIEFPFPSGSGLHIGHIRSYTALDVLARKRRMEGYNVLYPIGWDAFGLPTENYAIKTGVQPQVATKKNSDNFRKQLKSLGISFDWSREINTTDPSYYKWTQWLFLQFYKHDLAYKARITINWCPKDKIGLANEEVVNGCCERCGTPVEKKEKEQWMLAITKYADRLDKDLDTVNYLDKIKIQQRNWIGKSTGAEITFKLSTGESVNVFTTRPDTLYGVTYLVLAPEHELLKKLHPYITNWQVVEKYQQQVSQKEEIERTAEGKEKTGLELKGITAIHPATGEELPVWIADYVLASYGTGAVMAVPAHDERDYAFATRYNLPVKDVVIPTITDHTNPPRPNKPTKTRRTVHAVVFDPKRNAYLTLQWKQFPWKTVVLGGVEEGEDIVSAAQREIEEETGFIDLTFKKILGGPVEAKYFAAHKDENRTAITSGILFELQSDKKVKVSDAEKAQHEIVWTRPEDFIPEKMTNSELPFWIERMNKDLPYTEEGVLIDSGEFTGLDSEKAKKEIVKFVKGKTVTKYKLRDWIFSRQRYWGEPIPMISCEKCGWVPVPEKDLPVTLPKVKRYEPTDSGESPLASMKNWVNVKCPNCKGNAKRETDTMPNWAGSSWYFIRYVDPQNKKAFADSKKIKYWLPVDWYNGGMEHTTLHLLYSRFWYKFLYDIKLVPTSEPYTKRTSHGLILAEGGEKMSKSKGNVVNPDDLTKLYGADTLRIFEMFMGPFDQAVSWNSSSMIGPRRFIERVWKMASKISNKKSDSKVVSLLHKTIAKVTEDIETMQYNTAVSQLMICLNECEKAETISTNDYKAFLQLLSPFAPHVTDELWHALGEKKSIHTSSWPKYNKKFILEEEVTIGIQINGKAKAEITIAKDEEKDTVEKMVLEIPRVKELLSGQTIKKIIYVPGRVINIVTSLNV